MRRLSFVKTAMLRKPSMLSSSGGAASSDRAMRFAAAKKALRERHR
jgi:hypothetical protein